MYLSFCLKSAGILWKNECTGVKVNISGGFPDQRSSVLCAHETRVARNHDHATCDHDGTAGLTLLSVGSSCGRASLPGNIRPVTQQSTAESFRGLNSISCEDYSCTENCKQRRQARCHRTGVRDCDELWGALGVRVELFQYPNSYVTLTQAPRGALTNNKLTCTDRISQLYIVVP